MNSVTIHLEQSEYDRLSCYAESLGVSAEDIACAALSRLMCVSDEHEVQQHIAKIRDWRANNLLLWSDDACCLHVYHEENTGEKSWSRFY